MSEIATEKYAMASVHTGGYPGSVTDNVVGIDFITSDNATNTLSNRVTFPLKVPLSGSYFSYEKYLKFGATSVPSGYTFSNFKVWGDPDPPASGVYIYIKTTDTYAQPTQPTSTSGFVRIDEHYYDSESALTVSGTVSANGEYTDYFVLLAEVTSSADFGTIPQFNFYFSFDGYGQTFLARFNGDITDDISGVTGTFSAGLDTDDVANVTALELANKDHVDVSTNYARSGSDGRALSLDGSTQYAYHAEEDALTPGQADFMLVFVVKLGDGSGNYQGIYGSSASDRLALYYRNLDSHFNFDIGDGTSYQDEPIIGQFNTSFEFNRYEHIVALVDRSGNEYFFLNGDYKESHAVTLASSINVGDGATYYNIGKFWPTSGYAEIDASDARYYNFGNSGIYVTGTGGSDLEIRVGDSSGDIIYSEVSPYSQSNPGGLIPALYRNPGADLSELGYGSLENAGRSEQVTNGGFETYTGTQDDGTSDSFDGWSTGNTTNNYIDATATANSGTNAVKIDYSGAGSRPYISQYISEGNIANKWFELSFYTRGDGTQSVSYWIYDNTNSSFIVNETNTNITGTNYTKYSVAFKMGNTAQFSITFLPKAAISGSFYIDDVSLKRIGEVAHWKMNESGTPTTLADATDNGLDLATVGSPSMTEVYRS